MLYSRIIRLLTLMSVTTMLLSSMYVLMGGFDGPGLESEDKVPQGDDDHDVIMVKDQKSNDESILKEDMLPAQNEAAVVERHKKRREMCQQIVRDSTLKLNRTFWTGTRNKYSLSNTKGIIKECRTTVDLLVLVPSAPPGDKERHRIRDTWGNAKQFKNGVIKVVFLLGKIESKSVQELISKERNLYQDILEMDFVDSYGNLTLKTILGLYWLTTYCPNVKFVAKIDDDVMWAHLDDLLAYLRISAEAEIGVLCGAKNVGKPVARESGFRLGKWKTNPDQYPDECYPPYCDGCAGYVMSASTADKLFVTSQTTRRFWLEDIYITGILPFISGNVFVTQLDQPVKYIQNTCQLRGV